MFTISLVVDIRSERTAGARPDGVCLGLRAPLQRCGEDGWPATLAGRDLLKDTFSPGCNTSSILDRNARSEEHTSELQSLMLTSYAVFCSKKNRYNYGYSH